VKAPHLRPVLALLGLRGSGKSTLGRSLAEDLAWPFVDLDTETCVAGRRAGFRVSSAGELLRTAGVARFRELEAWALRRVLEPAPRLVLATGGGVVERVDNRVWLARSARSVFLQVPVELLAERLRRDPTERPALLGEDPIAELPRIAALRTPLYRAVAELELDCGAAQTAELVQCLRAHLGLH
jgi:shikimate kinase